MATGKTHSRHYRLYIDEVDLSGDARGLGSAGITYEEVDVTGWSNGIINYDLGRPRAFIEGFQAVFNNTALLGSHIELSAREEYLASLQIGIKAAPIAGDPAFGCPLEQVDYVVEGSGPLLVNANLNGPGQENTLPDRVWGKVLYPKTSIAATTGGTTVDFGAASAKGAIAYLHVLVADGGGPWSLKVQDGVTSSPTDDYITFSSDGQTITAEQGVNTGSMNRYCRFLATDLGAASGATFVVTIIPQ